MAEDISFLMERLQHLIPEAIMTGIIEGLRERRRIQYKTYDKIPFDKLKLRQAEGAYEWSEEWFTGFFLEFAHFQSEEIESEAIIETPDGFVVGAPLSKIQFIK